MADEKKPEGKSEPAVRPDPFVEIASMLLGLFLLVYVANAIIGAVVSNRIFREGLSSFSERGILLHNTVPLSEVENPLNGRVLNINKANVYDTPNGRNIGNHDMGERGKVLQGPVTIGGSRYWYVDYDSPPDGWVEESNLGYIISEPSILDRVILSIFNMVWYLKIFVLLLSVAGVIIIVYLVREITAIRANERKLLYPQVSTSSGGNIRWERVLAHINSLNQNDWRLAILEADIMLNDLLNSLSLPGETVGEKLKAVEKSDFTTVDNAWEAHKTRNIIAHEGGAFLLTQREGRRIVELYATVFREFQLI